MKLLKSWSVLITLLLVSFDVALGAPKHPQKEASPRPSEKYLAQMDELSALWSLYKYTYIKNGRVISFDEHQITTSEGQGYAMLRAVFQNDRDTFQKVWRWTQKNLQVRKEDRLFAWKWKNQRVVDFNAATDADTDIALALFLAANRFSVPVYKGEAQQILNDIWKSEILQIGEKFYVTGGNWAPHEEFPTLHVAYFAPYAYEVFAKFDLNHPWKKLVESSYHVLKWIYQKEGLALPPEIVFIDKNNGALHLKNPKTGHSSSFNYDAYPIFWRLAVDSVWSGRRETKLLKKALQFFKDEWAQQGRFWSQYTLQGKALSNFEGLPLYATVHSLAQVLDPELALKIRRTQLDPRWRQLMARQGSTYYFQNWIWFDRAFELGVARTYEEFLSFLRPFDFESFALYFPWSVFVVTLALFFLARFHPLLKIGFLTSSLYLCIRYLIWRVFFSLNFLEGSGIVISIVLLAAEIYCFSTVFFLLVQVGLKGGRKGGQKRPQVPSTFQPTVDIFIPIYSESCEILEKTLIAARAITYAHKKIFVCDDSHRTEVKDLAASYGAFYIQGPKKHAKAGNLNHALRLTQGELLVIFDTDHIPVTSFLEETVPYFYDSKMGFIQTPHHFYNEDIFQRTLLTGDRVPNEQDMFNHAIQRGRDSWGGSFFVGSGAVFRRTAMEEVGGFQLISITEDIHTSQHIHARGWKSAFVDQDLAVGLAAENLASFIVQRRRWMLGCLQIFFKDNPLFCRGLGLRHRIGYFASLYYFFYPIPRVIFWVTPLYFLLFHWHPIFSEVSVLLAYLIPSMVALPLISLVLLPGWPRMVWGSAYETVTSFTLFRSMFDLFLPKSLGFKVTPKGITSQSRAFDFHSSKATLIATAINLVAIIKGIIEFSWFGIEKDAYFFNLIWAVVNLGSLLVSLLIAWEKPQKRAEERIQLKTPFKMKVGETEIEGFLEDISLSGLALSLSEKLPEQTRFEIHLLFPNPIQCQIQLISRRRKIKGYRYGFQLVDLSRENYQNLLISTFASPETWKDFHTRHTQNSFFMMSHFFTGIIRSLIPSIRGNRKIKQELEAEVGEGLRRSFPFEVSKEERTYGPS